MDKFIRNAWYVAGWAEEFGRKLVTRKILKEHVLFYRKENGEPVAIGNICPHRFAPLNMGVLIGDEVQCGYHGLQFNSKGMCSLNPNGNKVVPAEAKVKSYPLVERDSLFWIWMGKADLADASKIPDFSHLTDPGRKTLRGYKLMEAGADLIVDNLMDASHAQFLHASFLKSSAFENAVQDLRQEGTTVYIDTAIANTSVPPSYKEYLDPHIDVVDQWVDFRWDPPSLLCNSTGITPAGQPRSLGAEKKGTHLVTPESERSSHYFFAHSRNFKFDDAQIDEQITRFQRIAFGEQDAPMIEACQRMMDELTGPNKKQVLLTTDVGVARVRRIVMKIIEKEESDPDLQPIHII